jgi:hypothetical protein
MAEFTREAVAEVVAGARELVKAHERRSPTSQHATLGEQDALFNVYFRLKQMFAGPDTAEEATS